MCIRVRSLRKFRKFIYIFFIIVTGRKCCCASIHGYDHGKTWESPFELNIFSFKPSAKKCVSWVYTSPTSVLSSAEVGFFSCKFRRHFFLFQISLKRPRLLFTSRKQLSNLDLEQHRHRGLIKLRWITTESSSVNCIKKPKIKKKGREWHI